MKLLLGTVLVSALAIAAPAMAQQAPLTLQQPDKDFLTKASEGNVSEIKLGQLAEHRSTNQEVKQFGQLMADDHTKAQRDLTNAMNGSDVVVPDHVTKDGAGLYDKLAQETGADFDHDYMHAMVDDHQDAVNAYNDEIKNGKMAKLRDYAQNTLPVVEQHLQKAKQINNQVAQNEK